MSKSGKCKTNLNFRTNYGLAEKNQKKKVKALCTSFLVLASQSGKTKIQMLTTSCRSLKLPT